MISLEELIERQIQMVPKELRQKYHNDWSKFVAEKPEEYLKLSLEWKLAQIDQFNKAMKVSINLKSKEEEKY